MVPEQRCGLMKLSHADMCCSDEDVHKCGRCQTEFSTLEAFIQHKLQQSCRRAEAREASGEDAGQEVRTGMMRGFIFSNYNKHQRQKNWMVISTVLTGYCSQWEFFRGENSCRSSLRRAREELEWWVNSRNVTSFLSLVNLLSFSLISVMFGL